MLKEFKDEIFESQIKNELRTVILRKAAQFEKNKKKK